MATSSAILEATILANLTSDIQLDVHQLYAHVAQTVSLMPDDQELILVQGRRTEPAWHRNVRNVLQSLKQKGVLLNQPRSYWRLAVEQGQEKLNVEKAWKDALIAATNCFLSGEIWYSPVEMKEYRVLHYDNSKINIQRLSGGEEVWLKRKDLTRAATMMNASGGTMTRRSLNRVVAKEAAIVFLYPLLTYSDDGEFIVINDTQFGGIDNETAIWVEREAANDHKEDKANVLRRLRKRQRQLKKKLLQVYGAQCCITGTAVSNVLIAAHIEPHALGGINISTNALLLRSDIHILYDDHFIAIDPETLMIYLSPELISTSYWIYNATTLKSRNDGKQPDNEKLYQHWCQIDWAPIYGSDTN
ncbi:HNH endonuclease signature motif containing protein [Mucilaginibacter sp.]|uniref:HNH endonuclease signature motif containing protein n=1 Tax=Mucilaginibacter sp. TaxID=1882438 RepID=UPI00260D668B|nr:HNH endonuclease signature motif containing protein [Mucilaginibacter sp.]MDB4925937.1 hypothetical protein [Mucilaginibacter sp.]